MPLADLEVELMRVRDQRSRQYLSDAIRSYRAGAYRPAITATWVAVAFDLIQKYRELASQNEPEAAAFITSWDVAVAGNQTSRLLELERGLLSNAFEKFGMFNSSDLRNLQRLVEDRHTSAHPAFVAADELYEPTDEIARSHIFTAIDVVLGQRPIRGRSILDAFSVDLLSPGFPESLDAAINYIEQKYLAHMKPSFVDNFGAVLAKSIVRNIPAEWAGAVPKVHRALFAIRQRRPDNWVTVLSTFRRLINDDDPHYRSNSLAAIGFFPELAPDISAAAIEALRTHCRDVSAMAANRFSYAAVCVPVFQDEVRNTFWRSDHVQKANALSGLAPPELWDLALRDYAAATSFRNAESCYDSFIAPYQARATADQVSAVFLASASNGQIWHAGGIPLRLRGLLAGSGQVPSLEAANALYIATSGSEFGDYAELWEAVQRSGWVRPQLQ